MKTWNFLGAQILIFWIRLPTKFSHIFCEPSSLSRTHPFYSTFLFFPITTFSNAAAAAAALSPYQENCTRIKESLCPKRSRSRAAVKRQLAAAAAVLHQKRSFLTAAVPAIPGKCTSCGGPNPFESTLRKKLERWWWWWYVHPNLGRVHSLSLSRSHTRTCTHARTHTLSRLPFLSRWENIYFPIPFSWFLSGPRRSPIKYFLLRESAMEWSKAAWWTLTGCRVAINQFDGVQE